MTISWGKGGAWGLLFLAAAVPLVSFAEDPVPAPPAAPSAPVASSSDPVANSVVKVFSTVLVPQYYKPWTKGSPSEQTGSGVVIGGHRILTNAHVVLYAREVQIQANQGGDRVSATVEAIAPGIDLAVLKLDDERFFDTHLPLAEAKGLPQIKDPVMVYGYPKGGDTLSITKGIVSRIEFATYNNAVRGLRIQIDAAVNPGNSGGPAVAGDKMVGLAFSHLGDSENIGYIIPCEEIDLFLQSIAGSSYAGKPALYDEFQTLQNPALRAFLKLDKATQGILVHKPFDPSDAYPLKEWDLVTKIGDAPVDDQGMVASGDDLHLFFLYMVQKTVRDGKVPLTVLRNGKELRVDVPALSSRPSITPPLEGTYPSYFILGPLVFSEVTREYMGGYITATNGADLLARAAFRMNPMVVRWGDRPEFDGERLVVVASPFFADKLAQGYSSPSGRVVRNVNGVPIRNLRHLVEIVRDSKDEFIQIETADLFGETLVFRREELLAETDKILSDNGIRSQGSSDALGVWNAGAAKAP